MTNKQDVREIITKNFTLDSIDSIEEDEIGGSHETFFVSLRSAEDLVVKTSDHDWEVLPNVESGFEIDAPVF